MRRAFATRTCRMSLGAGAFLMACVLAAVVSAQSGGKRVSGGNPTPGTPQPDPPNLADRVSFTGCLQATPAGDVAANASRFVLSGAERLIGVPPGTGGSSLATAASGRIYRLEAIDSQLSPFVGGRVEISGEIKAAKADAPPGSPPTLIVEFVRRVAAACP